MRKTSSYKYIFFNVQYKLIPTSELKNNPSLFSLDNFSLFLKASLNASTIAETVKKMGL